jgi:folylpolyglutamate synthase/dihydropteroate synthase
MLDGHVDEIVVTRPDSSRTQKWECLAQYFSGGRARLEENPIQALEWGLDAASPQDMILLAGSLYLAAGFRDYFQNAGGRGMG